MRNRRITEEELQAILDASTYDEYFKVINEIRRLRGGSMPLDWIDRVKNRPRYQNHIDALCGRNNASVSEDTLRKEQLESDRRRLFWEWPLDAPR